MYERQRASETSSADHEETSPRAGLRVEAGGGRPGVGVEPALRAVLNRRHGRRLEELLDVEREKRQEQIREQELDKERRRSQQEERNREQREAEWERFMLRESRELELRKEGQLARLLGEPHPGEPAAALRRLAEEDKRQAQQGLVALMSGGETRYKPLHQLSPEDMPARLAAERLRTTWLKKRQDGWLAQGRGSL